MVRLVIEEDTVYEIDEECMMRKEAQEEKVQKRERNRDERDKEKEFQ